ncbi:hypothetical protein ABLG96_15565 [Nakamurella sp. A5-74]|uniref:YfhO family protein n=1 Tax=Nakamurella sp. A5-74 TaxID=3158264 RepID=A0AAU8DKY3_9ACTN
MTKPPTEPDTAVLPTDERREPPDAASPAHDAPADTQLADTQPIDPRPPGPPPADPPTAGPLRERWRSWIPTVAWSVPLFAVVLVVHGLIAGAPSALVWSAGAGNIECIAKLGWSQFFQRCHQVGAPFGSPLLIGLPQTYVGAWLSYLPGIDAWRAYKIVTALCCAAGFAGTVALFRRWSVPVWLAAIGAALYLTSPTLIGLAPFTFTFHGYAQLPLYLWLLLLSLDGFAAGRRLVPAVLAVATCLLAVWTDGYSFIGTMVVIVVVGLGWLLSRQLPWRIRLIGSATWAAALLGSVGLYLVYVPSGGIDLRVGISAFRYLGLDGLTLLLPGPSIWYSSRAPWRSTLLNLWGDGSNQTTNFLGLFAVALVAVAVAFGLLRPRTAAGRERLTLALAGLACLVLAFGPALKFANTKIPITPSYDVPLSETRMWLPTALLYEHVPGFTEIRATYRIFAVTRFALIALAIVGLAAVWRSRARWFAPALALLLALEGSVNPIKQIRSNEASYALVGSLRSGVLADLQTLIRPTETVLLLPGSNDFLATALIPFTGASSFNIGVDKNFALAQAAWPPAVKQVITDYQRGNIATSGCALLHSGTADVIVLEFVPMGAGVRTATPDVALQAKAERIAAAGEAAGTFTVLRTGTALSLKAGPSC